MRSPISAPVRLRCRDPSTCLGRLMGREEQHVGVLAARIGEFGAR